MLYMICRQGDEPLVTLWSDEVPTLDIMAETVASFFGYESVDALVTNHPGLSLGWFHLH